MKNHRFLKKALSMLLALTFCVSLPLSVYAETVEEPPVTTDNADGTQTVTTTTTVTETEDGKTTVTVTIKDETAGTNNDGQIVNSTVTNTTTTITEGDTTQVVESEEGHETITTPGGEPAVDADLPDITLDLPADGTVVNGEASSSTDPVTEGDVKEGEDDNDYDYTITDSTIDRTASGSANTEDVVIEDVGSSKLTPIGPEDYDGKSNMLYSHPDALIDPEFMEMNGQEAMDLTILMPQAPEGYDYIITGFQEMINAERDEVNNAPIAIKIKRDNIVFMRDENGKLMTDDDGNYIVTYAKDANGGDKVDRIDNSPTIFALKKKDGAEGEYYFAYCIDADTDTKTGAFYKLANLEDSDYYTSEDAAGRLRTIVLNGYWGTDGLDENGNAISEIGNIDNIIAALKAYYNEDSEVEVQDSLHDRTDVDMVKVYDLLDELTEAEALAATQAAIWMLANGNANELTGEDGMHIQYPTYTYKGGSWHEYVETQGNNQYEDGREGTARMIAMMNWLLAISKEKPIEATDIVINEKNFVETFGITIKDKVEDAEANFDTDNTNDVYEADLNFTVAFIPDGDDNLLVYLYDKDGNPMKDKDGEVVVKRLATANGETAGSGDDIEVITPVNGVYTLTGLELQEGNFDFNLQIAGTQNLDQGVYIYTAAETSQTLVGLASGAQDVNVTGTFSLNFEVDEKERVVAEHHWRHVNDPITDDDDDDDDDDGGNGGGEGGGNGGGNPGTTTFTIAEESQAAAPGTAAADNTVEIEDEEVPLADAPKTGDSSLILAAISALSGLGYAGLNFTTRRKED